MLILTTHFSILQAEEVQWETNWNWDDIITPVKADKFAQLLRKYGYPESKVQFIENGFTNGFSLKFTGNRKVRRYAPNLKLCVGNPIEIWNKVIKEVGGGRYAGPYDDPPFDHFIQFPIGLVPKDKGKKTRLIFHLSYLRD